MSAIQFDPDDTELVALDDRNAEIDPDFELNEELAYNIGFGGRDPAEDGGY